MYNPTSLKAEEFISHEEIVKTVAYANKNKRNEPLLSKLLDKARKGEGLTFKQASVLLACDLDNYNEMIFHLAKQIKSEFYGNRIVLFAPLYLSNYCVNGCVYCPYHISNRKMPRKKLTREEVREEVIALQDMGHKRLALEAGEDPINAPIEYILECIRTIYSTKHKNGSIRRVNVNIAATTVENYKKLHEANIGTYILFQETYNKENYEKLHPTGPKSNYAYHTEAMDRAMQGGIDDVGLGVLFGLGSYQYEFAGLLMHAEHLEKTHGVGPHTISVPRLCAASDVKAEEFADALPDEIFEKIIACLRIAVPYTGIIVSTRESRKCRERTLELGVTQISGGSSTEVGGYTKKQRRKRNKTPYESSEQFDIADRRVLDDIVMWLMKRRHIPSFCTACYQKGRTGDRFMELCKTKQLENCCLPNALLTLKEYAIDYGSDGTKSLAAQMIMTEQENVTSDKVRRLLEERLHQIKLGKRGINF